MSQMTLEMEELREQNLKMKQELLYLRRVKFGRSSERFIPSDPNQLCLFQDQEQPEEATSEIKPILEEIHQETQARRNRIKAIKQRPVRQELPANLERIERVIEPQGVNLDEIPYWGRYQRDASLQARKALGRTHHPPDLQAQNNRQESN